MTTLLRSFRDDWDRWLTVVAALGLAVSWLFTENEIIVDVLYPFILGVMFGQFLDDLAARRSLKRSSEPVDGSDA